MKKHALLNNQIGRLYEPMIGVAIWVFWLALAIPNAMKLYKRLENSELAGSSSVIIKPLLLIFGPVIVSIVACSIRFYFEYRGEDEKPWIEIIIYAPFYLIAILVLAGLLLTGYKFLSPLLLFN